MRDAAPEPALADQARARLEEMIVSLELPPGSIWSELQLSEAIGIGRTPVREALQRLESDHLVRILPRHGAQITEINVSQQLLLLELRRVLERLIARDAARRATPQEREQLLEMAERLEALVECRCAQVPPPSLRHQELHRRLRAQSVRRPRRRALHAMSRRFYYLHYRKAHDLPVAAQPSRRGHPRRCARRGGGAAAASDR